MIFGAKIAHNTQEIKYFAKKKPENFFIVQKSYIFAVPKMRIIVKRINFNRK